MQLLYIEKLNAGLYKAGTVTYYKEGPEDGDEPVYKLPQGDNVTAVALQVVNLTLGTANRDELGWQAPGCLINRKIIKLLKFNHDLELGELNDNQNSFLQFQIKQQFLDKATSIETPFRPSLVTPRSSLDRSNEISDEEETSDEAPSPVAELPAVERTEETEAFDIPAKKFIAILNQKRPPQTPISSVQGGAPPTTKQLFETVAAITKMDLKKLIADTIEKIKKSTYLKGLVIRHYGDFEEHLYEIGRGKGSYLEILALSILLKRPIMVRAESEVLEVNMTYTTLPVTLLYTGDGGYDFWNLSKEFELDSLLDKNHGIDLLSEKDLQL